MSSDYGKDKEFTYDAEWGLYYIYVAPNTNPNNTTPDFQISTKKGNYTTWKTGLVYATGMDYGSDAAANADATAQTKYIVPGRAYRLSSPSDGTTHFMRLKYYHYNAGYTVYVTRDLSTMWIQPDIYVHDNIVGETATSSTYNWKFAYDLSTDKYRITIPGKYIGNTLTPTSGDIQFSTVKGSSYDEWKKGLLYVNGKYVQGGDVVPDANRLVPGITYNLSRVANTNSDSYWSAISGYNPESLYIIEISGDFSTLKITERPDAGLYITGTVAGVSYPLHVGSGSPSDERAYSLDNCQPFSYDSTNQIYYYEFTAPANGEEPIFSYSRYPSVERAYETWDQGSKYVPSGQCIDANQRNFQIKKFYTTTAQGEAMRRISYLTPGKKYTIRILKDLSKLWIEEGPYRTSMFITGGLTGNVATFMDFDEDGQFYYYDGNYTKNTYFSLFSKHTMSASDRVCCQNRTYSQALDTNNTKYKAERGRARDHMLDIGTASSAPVRIAVDKDIEYIWVKKNPDSPVLLLAETPGGDRTNTEANPLTFTYDNDVYTCHLGITDGTKSYRISKFASAAADAPDISGFNSGLIGVYASALNLGSPTSYITETPGAYTNLDFTVPKLWGAELTVDLNSRTITLTGETRPVLYVAGSFNGIMNADLIYDSKNNNRITPPTEAAKAAIMEYDSNTGVYSYNATTNLLKSFAIYFDRSCTPEYLYTCRDMKNIHPLATNTKYVIEDNKEGGYQFLSRSAATGDVTIYVQFDDDGHDYLWVEDNEVAPANQTLFLAQGDATATVTDVEPNASHIFTRELGTIGASQTFSLSRYANKDADGETVDNGHAFETGMVIFENPTLELGKPVRYRFASQSDFKSAPRREPGLITSVTSPDIALYSASLTIDTQAQTVTLEGSDHCDLYITGPAICHQADVWRYTYDEANPTAGAYKFTYDRENQFYYVTVEQEYDITEDLGVSYSFFISTGVGSQTNWNAGVYTCRDMDNADKLTPGQKYALIKGSESNKSVYSNKVDNYHRSTTYTYYVSADLSQIWIQPKLNIIGWLTGGYGYATRPDADKSNIHSMEYDPVKNEYYYVSRNKSASVFEISYVAAKDGSAKSWYDGMLYYTDYDPKESDWDVVRTVQIGLDLTTDEKHEAAVAANDLNVGNGHYPLYPGRRPQTNRYADHTINTYNPNYEYTVHVSGDLSYMWVTAKEVHMPLTAADFVDADGNKVPHYFLVGTRTADWRLLPEWELTGSGATRILKNRFMYDGYFAFAKVDNYQDYIHHRYQLFSNTYTSQQNYNSVASPLLLSYHGESGAIHYPTADNPNPENPIHDISNSVTWNLDPAGEGYENPTATGEVTARQMERTVPWRIETLTLVLDDEDDYNPIGALFTGTNDPKVINAHRTFSLCGSDINYEQLYDFGGQTGEKNLRTMTSAPHLIGEPGDWSNSWISFDSEGKPYFDAYGNTLYLTAYDREWIDNHDVFFDMKVSTTHGDEYLIYDSENLFFTRKEDLQDLDKDPYKDFYDIHTLASGKLVGGNSDITFADSEHQYAIRERLLSNYSATSDDERYEQWEIGSNNPDAYDGWQCYVIRDVWLKGNFKVWTGWGGNVRAYEGWLGNNPHVEAGEGYENALAHRWFYGDLGHELANTCYAVEGQDVFIPVGAEQKDVKMYKTYRHINSAYFKTEGSNDVSPTENNVNVAPQFYNRIVLWYNVKEGTKTDGDPNGVLLFVQEGATPTAQAFRQTGSNNKLRVEFTIYDSTDAHADWPLVDYTIERYTYQTDGDDTEVEVLQSTFGPFEFPEGMVEGNLAATPMNYYDNATLPSGTYFYRVTISAMNPDTGEISSKTAATNSVTISEANKPILAQAIQERDDEQRYKFNVRLTTAFPKDPAAINQTSHYSYAVFEDARQISITVDKATAIALNNASSVEVLPYGGKAFIFSQNGLDIREEGKVKWDKMQSKIGDSAIGFTTFNGTHFNTQAELNAVSDWKSILRFDVSDSDDDDTMYTLPIKLQQLYVRYNSDNDTYVVNQYFDKLETLTKNLSFPVIVWKNVQPTSGVVNEADPYSFTVELKPDPKYQSIWTDDLKLQPAKTATHVYAPNTALKITDVKLMGVSEKKVALDHENITRHHLMPPGAKHGDNVAFPVHYPKVNEIQGNAAIVKIPVADEVTDEWDLNVAISLGNEQIQAEGSNNADIGGTISSLPLTISKATTVGGSSYYAAGSYAYYRPTARVTYQKKNDANNTTIRTKEVTSTSNAKVKFPAQTIGIYDKPHFMVSDHVLDGDTKYNARMGVKFIINTPDNENNVAYYQGFHVEIPKALQGVAYNYDPGRAAHGGRPIDQQWGAYWDDMMRVAGGTSKLDLQILDYVDWDRVKDDPTEQWQDDVHNWSHLSAQNGHLSVQVEPIVQEATKEAAMKALEEVELQAEIYTIFPVVKSNLKFTPNEPAGPAGAPRKEAEAPKTIVHFDNVIPIGTKQVVPVQYVEGSSVTTGVEGIIADSETGDAVYYNLQGIRVLRPEPGKFYIRCQGTKAEKIIY